MKSFIFSIIFFSALSAFSQNDKGVSCSVAETISKYKVANPSLWIELSTSKSNDCLLKLRNTQGYEILSFDVKTFVGEASQSNVCSGSFFTEGAIAAMLDANVTSIEIDNLRVKNFGGTIVIIKGSKISK